MSRREGEAVARARASAGDGCLYKARRTGGFRRLASSSFVRSFCLSVCGSVLRWKLPHVVAEHREDEERSSSGGGRELMESSGMMLVKSEIESCYPGPSAAAPSVVIGGAPDGVEGGHRHQVVRRRRREPPLLAPIGGGGGIGKPLPSITVKRSSRFRGVSR